MRCITGEFEQGSMSVECYQCTTASAVRKSNAAFFSFQRLLASARSFNTFSCMLHRIGKLLIYAYIKPHLVGGHKSELVWDLYIVQQPSRFHSKTQQTKRQHPKQQNRQNQNQTKNKHQNASTKQPKRKAERGAF